MTEKNIFAWESAKDAYEEAVKARSQAQAHYYALLDACATVADVEKAEVESAKAALDEQSANVRRCLDAWLDLT